MTCLMRNVSTDHYDGLRKVLQSFQGTSGQHRKMYAQFWIDHRLYGICGNQFLFAHHYDFVTCPVNR